MSIYHKSLTPERWRGFGFPTQILMIANEMNRACNALRHGDRQGASMAYTRALELTDLTVAVNRGRSLLRELLRWRSMLAREYLKEDGTPESVMTMMKVLLLFSGVSSKQIRSLNL